ncbi:MAG: DAK2 domain-containing protein [Evtepia sp.]
MIQVLDGTLLARMIVHASMSLNTEKQKINELNVFPVPDGDTGTNMSLTIGTAAAELLQNPPSNIGQVAAMNASAMLRGARGNSGVILSLLFRGFAKALKELETIDGTDFAIALNFGVTAAYKAVMKPAEGTILTVSRVCANRAETAAGENASFEYVLQETIRAAEEALPQTTEQNPTLKKAGVVDAGGMGYLIILRAMMDELQGKPMPEGAEPIVAKSKAKFKEFSTDEIRFAYCTEFICSREAGQDPEVLRRFLNGMGDSLVLVDDEDMIKVHVHTNHPGRVLEEALHYGGLQTVKVENMRLQHTEILEDEPERIIAAAERKYGFVAVCAGDGLATVFGELGVDGMISGGQTMNPSTEDILREIDGTPAEVVFVLPNNKNIIMAAQQCVPLAEGKTVIVIPSKTVPQGISAMMAVCEEATPEENTAAMEEAMSQVTTMEITCAARNSEFDGTSIKEGDYLALIDNQLFGTESELSVLLGRISAEAAHRNAEFINVFYGEGVERTSAQQTAERFMEVCPDAEVTLVDGGQPIYSYLISVE